MISLFFSPLALRLNFEAFDFRIPDSLYMLSNSFWVFIILLQVLLASCLFLNFNKAKNLLPLASGAILIAFPISQLPVIMGWDSYVHAMSALQLQLGAPIGGPLYLGYPSTFILSNTLNEFTSIGIIFSGAILAVLSRALVLCLLYLLARTLIGMEKAFLAPTLFILGNFRFWEYTQYCPEILGLAMYLLCIYLLIKKRTLRNKNMTLTILFLVLSFVLATTHSFSSLILVATLIGLPIVKISNQLHSNLLLLSLSLLTMWLFWQIYIATSYLQINLAIVLDNVRQGIMWGSIGAYNIGPGTAHYNIFLSSYRIILHAIVLVLALGGLLFWRKKTETKFILGVIIGCLFLTAMLVTLSTAERDYLNRLMLFGYVPASLLASLHFGNKMNVRSKARKFMRPFQFASKILPFVSIALILVSFFAANLWVYSISVHVWEARAVEFVATNNIDRQRVMTDDITAEIYRFFDTNPYTFSRYGYGTGLAIFNVGSFSRYTDTIEDIQKKAENAKIFIRSYRQVVDWYYYAQGTPINEWNALDHNVLLDNHYGKVYDDGYVQVYWKFSPIQSNGG